MKSELHTNYSYSLIDIKFVFILIFTLCIGLATKSFRFFLLNNFSRSKSFLPLQASDRIWYLTADVS